MNTPLIMKSNNHPNPASCPRMAIIAAALSLAFGPDGAQAQQRPLGVDVSYAQGAGINWTSVKGAGITFAWAKATEGTYDHDVDFIVNENNGKAAGVFMGAYDFCRPDLYSPATEDAYYWAFAGGYMKADGKTLSPMLDFETFNGVVGASTYSAWANAWCSDIKADASAASVILKPAIYTSTCTACNFDTSVAGWLSDLAAYNGEGAQTGTPWNICTSCEVWGANVWTTWQYTDAASVSGISGGVDADVFNGISAGLVTTMVATAPQTHVNKCRDDFNGDGHDDYAFFRPSDGTWHITFSSDNSNHSFQYGANGDIPLCDGDFDGDGCADAVLFRPSTSTWYIRFSKDGSSHSFAFGQSGDIPILGGDHNGDGIPDATVFRPSTSTWYVRFSTDGSIHSFAFGTTGDIPLLNGDFDGDGSPDAVLFRPSTGAWYVRYSKDGSVHTFNNGQSGDVPLLGDSNNDGIPDATVFRPSNGTWYVRFSGDGSIHNFQYGTSGDKPWTTYTTTDGSLDQDLYRPSNGRFYVRDGATGNFTSIALGTSTDIPVH